MKDNFSLYNGEVNNKSLFNDDPRIRVPSLKRKTAWKRFYKLFPHLKGKKVWNGRSRNFDNNGNPEDLPKSFIPLKQVKMI